jgi:2-polyprenyl-3-methyl-5-hydroxy-6-metoxy-1,4-benzoquinol methylase
MLETLDTCPVCDHDKFREFLKVKDYTVSAEEFNIVECVHCNFRFTNPRPKQQYIGKYYASDKYISHTNSSQSIMDKAYKTVRYITLRDKLKLVASYKRKGKLLDIGCGTGNFLEVCADKGWNIEGVEPGELARAQAKSLNPTAKIEAELEAIVGKFDIITMWHVLEHVHALNPYLKKIYDLLEQDGKLIIAVPNNESFDAHHYGESWAAYDVPRHLYHFTNDTIKKALKKNGMHLVARKGMPFDAFYVSLLSEQYKYNKKSLLKSIRVGLESNQFGKKDNNYSSMIYIFEKETQS